MVRASPWFVHPRSCHQGSRWSPQILKCVNRHYRLPSNIKNVTWLPCLALLTEDLLRLHHPDNQGQPVHVKAVQCFGGGYTAARGWSPRGTGGAGEWYGKAPQKWLSSALHPLFLPFLPDSQPDPWYDHQLFLSRSPTRVPSPSGLCDMMSD